MDNNKCEVPAAKNPDSIAEQFDAFVELVRILRKECPWDRKQTNESIAHLLVEECYEAIEAIEKKDDDEFSKELGDILLHIVMHAVMAEQRGAFNIIDVITKEKNKMVHRHPHVFGDVAVSGTSEVLKNWEALKMKEGQRSILQGVPKSMPGLLRAQRVQHKASGVGFDWDNKNGAWDKIEEELKEFRTELDNSNHEKAADEFGDFLFALVNAARFEDIVAEEVMQRTNDKFTRRFQYIETKAHEAGKLLKEMTLEEMDKFWDEAKSLE